MLHVPLVPVFHHFLALGFEGFEVLRRQVGQLLPVEVVPNCEAEETPTVPVVEVVTGGDGILDTVEG